MKSINSYKDTLMYYSIETTPESYGHICIKLGDAYAYLAKLQNVKENKKLASESYDEALKVYTVKDYPEIHETITYKKKRAMQ